MPSSVFCTNSSLDTDFTLMYWTVIFLLGQCRELLTVNEQFPTSAWQKPRVGEDVRQWSPAHWGAICSLSDVNSVTPVTCTRTCKEWHHLRAKAWEATLHTMEFQKIVHKNQSYRHRTTAVSG